MSDTSHRIVILQSCDQSYAPLLEATAGANANYARMHGYAYRPTIGNVSLIPHTGNFNRYYLLRGEIDAAAHDWALCLDADAIVVDCHQPIESIIDRDPDKLLIACRGAMRGDHDINIGVFLLNLRHPLARVLVEYCIRYVESLPPANSSYRPDQWLVHQWLVEHRDASGRVPIVRCYTHAEYNLFNYDGAFIRHVLREFGDFDARVGELRRLAHKAQSIAESPSTGTPLSGSARGDSLTRSSSMVLGAPSRFQREHRILVATPAAYREAPPSSKWLIESCRRFGIELTLLGQGEPYPNNYRKVSLVAEYLRQHPEYRYVLQVDFKDVVVCATLRELFYKYQSLGHAIVAAAGRVNFPMPSHAPLCPDLGTSLRYLNSGTIFSTTEAWLAAFEVMQKKERFYHGNPPEIGCRGMHIFSCDQAAWSELYVKREADIALDSRCELFQVLNQTDWGISAANRDFVFEGRRIKHRETGARPCLIHANASIPLEPWANHVLNPPTVWIWPLIARLREADRSSLRDVGFVEQLLLELGLHQITDGHVPDAMLPYTGKGLMIWQRPREFARYLVWLAGRAPIHSYVEIGVESGGSFIATIEYLRHFHPLRVAIGVDPVMSPPVFDYVSRTSGVHFIQGTQASDDLRWLMDEVGAVDLVLIDGDHSATGVRADWEFARSRSRCVVFHDIAENLPGVRSLWTEIRSHYPNTWEFVDADWRPHLWGGIGAVDLKLD